MSLRTLSLSKTSSNSKPLIDSQKVINDSGALAGIRTGRIRKKISLDVDTLKSIKIGSLPSSRANSKEPIVLTPKSIFSKELNIENVKTDSLALKALSKKLQVSSSLMQKITRFRWKDMKIPLSPSEVIEKFSDFLPVWEQGEIMNYNSVYYIGKNFKPKDPIFDDIEGNYRILIKDHISFRYEIIGIIGSGTFGQVVEVYDHCDNRSLALKIIKNRKRFNRQAKIEIEVLEFIKEVDKAGESNIIEILDKFEFRGHMVIIT